jgi:hypothetical protein
MPFSYSILMMPAMILGMAIKDPSPIARYVKAGATTPDTARNPVSLKIRGRYLLKSAIRRGVLIDAGEGRYFVDLNAYRRRRIRFIGVLMATAAVVAAAMWWFFLRKP